MPTAIKEIDMPNIELAIDTSSSLYCVLHHAGISFIHKISLKNTGRKETLCLVISLTVHGYGGSWQKQTDPIGPGQEINLESIDIPLDYARLEGLTGRTKTAFDIKINGTVFYRETVNILGFYEFPTTPEMRIQKTLACFVQPANQTVQQIMAAALKFLKNRTGFVSFKDFLNTPDPTEPARPYKTAEIIYNTILEKCSIIYDEAPTWSYEQDSQTIRPPHQVVPYSPGDNPPTAPGRGTCIDLSLLFASCLENISMSPLIIVIRNGPSDIHAIAGFWNRKKPSFNLFVQKGELVQAVKDQKIIIVETTGFTLQKKLAFETAVIDPENNPPFDGELDFALDIKVARDNGLLPLQFSWAPGLIRVINEAERIAFVGRSRVLEAKHLLFSLFLSDIHENQNLSKAFKKADIDIKRIKKITRDMTRPTTSAVLLPNFREVLKKSDDYIRVLSDMTLLSRMDNLNPSNRIHLTVSLFRSDSQDIRRILDVLGMNTDHALEYFRTIFPWLNRMLTPQVLYFTEDSSQKFLTLFDVIDLDRVGLDLKRSEKPVPETNPDLFTMPKTPSQSLVSTNELNHEGLSKFLQCRYDQGISCFEQALKLEKNNATALNGKGYCLIETGDINAALEIFNTVLEKDPFDLYANMGGIICTHSLGRKSWLKSLMEKTVRIHPRIPALWFRLSLMYQAAGEKDKTLDSIRLSADLLIRQKRAHEALIVIQTGLKYFPEDLHLLQFLGWASRLEGNREKDLLKSRDKLETLYGTFQHPDPETAGLLAGTCKRLWLMDPVRYPDHLKRALDLYYTAWLNSDRKNIYVGINAATLLLLLDRPRASTKLAKEILKFYQDKNLLDLPQVGAEFSSYWYRAIQAEAELLLGHLGRARRIYTDMINLHKDTPSYIESSMNQIDQILPKFGLTLNAGKFLQKPGIHLSGRRITIGIINLAGRVLPKKLITALKDALTLLDRLLPSGTMLEILTGLLNFQETTVSLFLMANRQALLRFVQPLNWEKDFWFCDTPAEVKKCINKAEDIIFIPENKTVGNEQTITHSFIQTQCDLVLIIKDKAHEKTAHGTTVGPFKEKKPMVCIHPDRDYEIIYSHLESLLSQDFLKGKQNMYSPNPIDTSKIRLSRDLLDLQELLGRKQP